MKSFCIRLSCLLIGSIALLGQQASAAQLRSIFNGKDLSGWEGDTTRWSVKNGSIYGQTTKDAPVPANTFLTWTGGEVSDFEFTCKVKFEGNNSGVQYRSQPFGDSGHALMGYQADLHPKPEYFGMMYGEKFGKRGIIAQRHSRIEVGKDGKTKVIQKVAPSEELVTTEWNTLQIVAVGNRLIHLVNGVITVDVTDNHPDAMSKGKLGLQLHRGNPMTVEFKDLKIRPLKGRLANQILENVTGNFPKASGTKKATAKKKTESVSNDWASSAPKPDWIWRADKTDKEPIYLRHSFDLSAAAKSARIYTTCDNGATVWINGKQLGTIPDWYFPIQKSDLAFWLKPGSNHIAVRATNAGGVAAFVLKLEVNTTDGKTHHILSDVDWKLSTKTAKGWEQPPFNDKGWTAKLKSLGKLGVSPWKVPKDKKPKTLANTSELEVAKDFKVDKLYTVPNNTQGSWVAICTEPSGGFYACDQGKKGLFHISVSGKGVKVTPVPLMQPDSKNLLSGAQGLTWALDSLWFHKNGGHLYRITDTNGDGTLDKVEAQPSGTGGGEHGNHSVIPDESGKGLYVVGGNHAPTPPEDAIARNRVQSWNEDLLLPRLWDARGHARGRLAPGGWIAHYDPAKKTFDLLNMGYRNEYDVTLNSAGDLFTYDADMEWDLGSHWYRPTRINFAVSGSDHGWRSGTGKWPTYYEDSLPPVVEIGPGSPTGFIAGTEAKFPTKYQRALFALDWTFGTIWAIHPKQQGAGYTASKEAFVSGAPLPVTDGVIGKDGNLYFLVGGRGTQSALHRVRYVGPKPTRKAPALKPTKERELARSLENFHGIKNKKAVSAAWPHLSSSDVYLRHAARVAIESQPATSWVSRLKKEKDSQTIITASVALARSGSPTHQGLILDKLQSLDFKKLTERQKLGALRAYALTFIRLGSPSEAQTQAVTAKLDPLLPSKSADLNTELVRVLTYLQSPTVVQKTVRLIKGRGKPDVPDWAEIAARNARYGQKISEFLNNAPPSREVYYALMISNARKGWSTDARRTSIELLTVAAKGSGGASFPGFLNNIRDLHLGAMSNKERKAISDVSGEDFNPVPNFEITPPKGPGQNYTVDSAMEHMRFKNASYDKGRSLFFAISCGACHRFNGLGGDIGPDLTSIPNKFDTRYVLEAIIDPSKDISDQYGMFEVALKNGETKTGLYVQNGNDVSIYPPDHTEAPTNVTLKEVKSVKQLPVSQMPPGLINYLNPEELRDLMAYLMSGGDRESKIFRK